jgi:hypothetical protein
LAIDMDPQRLLHLVHILEESDLIIDCRYRKDILELWSIDGSLYKNCTEFIDLEPGRFAIKFCDFVKKACNAYASINSELIDFFTIFCDRDKKLSEDNKIFIHNVQKELEEAPTGSNRSSEISEQLSRHRQEYTSPPPPINRITIDKSLLIDYNLEKMVKQFSDTLDEKSSNEEEFEGSFVFAVNGRAPILEEYYIERILKTLKDTTGREYTKHQAWLNPSNYRLGLNTIKDQVGIKHFRQLFEGSSNTNTDIVLIVWNIKVLPESFFGIATQYWQEIEPQIFPYLKNPSRCFIMLWADEDAQSAVQHDFVRLPVPRKFEPPNIAKWLRVELRKHRVDELNIDRLINKIKCYDGEPYSTYRALKSELQLLGR